MNNQCQINRDRARAKKCREKAGWKSLWMAGAIFLAAGLAYSPVYAQEQGTSLESVFLAGWQQSEDQWYYYDESGQMCTGWIQAENERWYYLDTETGSWIQRPVLDNEAVVHLLENYINKAGYYRNEEYPLEIREDWRNNTTIFASVRAITGPNSYSTLNNYEINKKTGKVKPAVGEKFDIYD